MTKHGKEELVIVDKKKAKKKQIKKRVHKELSKIPVFDKLNTYLHGLLDPENIDGVRVPDFCSLKTSTFKAQIARTLIVGTGGCCGAIFGVGTTGAYPTLSPFGGLVPYPRSSGNQYTTGFILAQNMSTATMIVNTPTQIQIPNFSAGTDFIPKNFSRVRLASFGVKIGYTGAVLNKQGKITLAWSPAGTLTNKIANCTLSLDDVKLLPGYKTFLVPDCHLGWAELIWKPTDFADQQFCFCGPNDIPGGDYPSGCAPCNMFVFVDGAVSTQTFEMQAFWNFEAIPVNNTTNFTAARVAVNDPIALAHANTRMQEVPLAREVKSVDNTVALKEGVDHAPMQEQKSMMEQVIEMLPKGASAVKDVVETLSPVVSSVLSLL